MTSQTKQCLYSHNVTLANMCKKAWESEPTLETKCYDMRKKKKEIHVQIPQGIAQGKYMHKWHLPTATQYGKARSDKISCVQAHQLNFAWCKMYWTAKKQLACLPRCATIRSTIPRTHTHTNKAQTCPCSKPPNSGATAHLNNCVVNLGHGRTVEDDGFHHLTCQNIMKRHVSKKLRMQTKTR